MYGFIVPIIFRVELIGLGNGTACRETEMWLKFHHISENTPVVIVPEQGASIYSISKEAQKVPKHYTYRQNNWKWFLINVNFVIKRFFIINEMKFIY